MRRASIRLAAALIACGAIGGALTAAAYAQTLPGTSDYSLPPSAPAPQPAPPVAGPVDRDVPAPRPATTTSPSATATPTIVIPVTSPPPTRPVVRAVRGAATADAPATSTTPRLDAAAAPAPTAIPDEIAPPAANQSTAAASAPVAPAASPATQGWAPFAALGALVLAMIASGAIWLQRQRNQLRALPAPDFIRPIVPEVVLPTPAPAVPAPAMANPAPAQTLTLVLDATRMSATLVNATLAYRLSVTNTGSTAIEAVTIGGDMISAHASLPVEQQLGLSGEVLPVLHRVARIEPGESIALGGDIRLPLTAILPLRSGNATMFVPLARIEALGQADGMAVATRNAYLVGQQPESPSARLQPFRLDLGPRVYAQVGQRPIRMES